MHEAVNQQGKDNRSNLKTKPDGQQKQEQIRHEIHQEIRLLHVFKLMQDT